MGPHGEFSPARYAVRHKRKSKIVIVRKISVKVCVWGWVGTGMPPTVLLLRTIVQGPMRTTSLGSDMCLLCDSGPAVPSAAGAGMGASR